MSNQPPKSVAVPFKYLHNLRKGKTPTVVPKDTAGALPLLNTVSLRAGVAGDYAATEKAVIAEQGDTLILCDGSGSGQTFVVPFQGVVGSTLALLTESAIATQFPPLLPALHYYILQHIGQTLQADTLGIAIPHVRMDVLESFPIQIWNLDTQAKIAAYLDYKIGAIDAAIDQAKQQLDHVKAYRFSVIQEALMPFPRKRLKYLVSASISGEVIDQSWWNKGTELLFTCSKLPMASNYSQFPSKKRTTSSDLLITRNATPYVFLPPLGSIYSNVVQRISLTADLLPQFGVYALQSAADSDMVGYGVSIPSFNYGKWAVLPVSVPSLPVQAEIAAFLDQKISAIDKTIATLQQLLTSLPLYRQSLISDVVTGQLAIPDDFTVEPPAMPIPQ